MTTPPTTPTNNLWLKLVICCVLLALAAANQLSGDWHSALAWPWNGVTQLGGVFLEALSPIVFIYLVILLKKWAKF